MKWIHSINSGFDMGFDSTKKWEEYYSMVMRIGWEVKKTINNAKRFSSLNGHRRLVVQPREKPDPACFEQ